MKCNYCKSKCESAIQQDKCPNCGRFLTPNFVVSKGMRNPPDTQSHSAKRRPDVLDCRVGESDRWDGGDSEETTKRGLIEFLELDIGDDIHFYYDIGIDIDEHVRSVIDVTYELRSVSPSGKRYVLSHVGCPESLCFLSEQAGKTPMGSYLMVLKLVSGEVIGRYIQSNLVIHDDYCVNHIDWVAGEDVVILDACDLFRDRRDLILYNFRKDQDDFHHVGSAREAWGDL